MKNETNYSRIIQLEKRIAELEAKLSPKGRLHIVVVQDRSSSMHSRAAGVIDGFNEYVDTLKKEEADADAAFTLVQFNEKFSVIHDGIPLAEVEHLTTKTYEPSGCTALLDAVGKTVSRLDEQMAKDDRAIVVVMTDGYENASKVHTGDSISKLVQQKEDTDKWTFVYIGADQNAWAVGTSLGFSAGNTISMTNDAASYRGTFKSLAGAQNKFRAGGMSATKSFTQDLYTPEVEKDAKDSTDG